MKPETFALIRTYALAGRRLLPLYTIITNEDGSPGCACGDPECRSAGKHPREDLVRRGVNDATSDLTIIESWPDDINIGMATSATEIAIDIDDTTSARALMEPDIGLRGSGAAVTVTRRGGHLHGHVEKPTTTHKIKTKDGRTLGEVRAAGAYVAVPPSLHLSGCYRWLNGNPYEDGGDIPLYEGDGQDLARWLFGLVDISVADRIATVSVDARGPVSPCDIPFAVPQDALKLRQLLTGTYPTDDRSDSLFTLACEAFRVASDVGFPLDEETMVGVVMKVDSVAYRKFVGRADANQRYWELVVRAYAEAQKDIANAAAALAAVTPPPQVQAAQPAAQRTYDWADGAFVHRGMRGNQPTITRICNFEPVVVEVLNVWDGSENDGHEDWVAHLGNATVRLTPDDRSTPMRFHQMVQEALPLDHIVEHDQWPRFFTGLQYYSLGKAAHRQSYSASGWVGDLDAFLLPSAPGAITPGGFDDTIKFEAVNPPERLMQYGHGVQPRADCDFADVLHTLYTVAEPAIVVPLMAQMWAAPMASLGVSRSIVHLFAKTGSFKTTMCRCALSLYGRFVNEQDDHIDSWTGTTNSIQATMHRVRDLPLLVDDFKVSMFKRDQKGEVIRLVQNYADGTARSRLDRNQKEQKLLIPRSLVVSTGEDVWDSQQSAMARTIVVDVNKDSVDTHVLGDAQLMAINGCIGALGYEWLQWLTTQGQVTLRRRISEGHVHLRKEAEDSAIGRQHPRVVSVVASLLATDLLFKQFLIERVPAFAEQYKELSHRGWKETVKAATNQAEAAKALSPYESLRTVVTEAIGTQMARLAPRLNGGAGVGSSFGDVVGYVDDVYVWLSEATTFGFYERQMSRRGHEASFSWSAFIQEAIKDHGAKRTDHPTRVYGAGHLRLLAVPSHEFIDISESSPSD